MLSCTSPGSVVRAALDGSNVTVLASSQSEPSGVAVDAQFIYWAETGSGTIWKLPR